MNLYDIDLSDLRQDGDTLQLPDGRTLRLVIEQDWEASINDFDCYGRIEKYSHPHTWPEGHRSRPDGFDGNAEKLSCGRDAWIWWQAPAYVVRGTDEFRALRSHVIELLDRGFYCIGLELLGDKDFYGRPIVVNRASLAGCDGTDPSEYVFDLLLSLLGGES